MNLEASVTPPRLHDQRTDGLTRRLPNAYEPRVHGLSCALFNPHQGFLVAQRHTLTMEVQEAEYLLGDGVAVATKR